MTHRAVDAEAGAPPGTTSNYFRTRLALLEGALRHVADLEAARLATQPLSPDSTAASIAHDAAVMMAVLLGPARPLTLARHTLFLEAVWEPQLQPVLTEMTERWWSLLSARLAAAGACDPDRQARWLLAYIDGLIVDQLVRPLPDFDAEAALLAGLDGMTTRPL